MERKASTACSFCSPAKPGVRFPKTNVWIDPAAASCSRCVIRKSEGAGDTVLAWLHPLHSGEAFGLVGRIVVLLAGITPPLLFVTGVMRWRQKGRARNVALHRPKSGAGRRSGPRGA
jgi:uncharacterized iron-regulated membrane protein